MIEGSKQITSPSPPPYSINPLSVYFIELKEIKIIRIQDGRNSVQPIPGNADDCSFDTDGESKVKIKGWGNSPLF